MGSQTLAIAIFFLSAFILGYIWVRCFSTAEKDSSSTTSARRGISESVYRDSASKYVKEGAAERIRRRMKKN